MRSKSLKSSQPVKRKAKAASQAARKAVKTKAKSKGIARPFDQEIERQAKTIVADHQIVVRSENSEWYGRGLELPHVFGNGATPSECIQNTRDALTAAVGYLLERGKPYPSPAKHARQTA